MLVTEKQASQTWCPFQGGGRAWEHSLRPAPRAAAGEDARLGVEHRSCIGMKCMAWRWVAVAPRTCEESAPVGYCGLAGVPELLP